MATCYRHPNRETGVSCSNCGRPICPECMTSTPVGMRCPECARERTKVTPGAASFAGATAYATYALIGLNAIVFLAEMLGGGGGLNAGGNDLAADGGICGNAIADGGPCGLEGSGVISEGGEVWRIVTGAFLHASPLHLLFNMFALYILGTLIEPAIGTWRFIGIYFAALFAGSAGALLMSDPNQITVGASGAVFGLMAAAFVVARSRGVDEIASQIGLFVVLNLVFTFSIPGISIGGHIGGLIGGAIAALAVSFAEKQAGSSSRLIEAAGILVVAGVSIAGALAFAAPG